MRSSFSCARRRRLRCLPSPAASSISSRRSRGRESTIASTLPCETTECISLPSPESESTSSTSTSRQRAPFRRYSPSPPRSEPAHDRDLGEVALQRAVGVVDHHLDLGRARALDAVAAGEDHVLHRLAAHRQRALLAERPEHGVGDVRLAGAVRPDDHGHARAELELGPVGEGLEALHRDRPQVHQPAATSRGRSSACSAASCSALFLVFPSPRPSSCPATSATATKRRSCAGPSSESIR